MIAAYHPRTPSSPDAERGAANPPCGGAAGGPPFPTRPQSTERAGQGRVRVRRARARGALVGVFCVGWCRGVRGCVWVVPCMAWLVWWLLRCVAANDTFPGEAQPLP